MKKVLVILAILFLFAACTGNNAATDENEENGNGYENGEVSENETPNENAPERQARQRPEGEMPHEIIVATINGFDVPAGFVMFRLQEAMFDLGIMENYSNEAVLEEAVRLSALPVIIAAYAEQHGIVLSPDELAELEFQIDVMIEQSGGEEIFLEMYAEMGIQNVMHFEQIMHKYELMDKVVTEILENPNLFAEFEQYMEPHEEEEEEEEEVLAAKHILFMLHDFEDADEAMEFARQIWERAAAGEDFDMLIAEYGNDPGMIESPQGYTFTRGVMVPEFEETTRSLRIGEISEPFEAFHGIHIVLRVEPDLEDVMRPWSMGPTLEDRQVDAIVEGFERRAANDVVFEFLPALYEMEVPLF
jgi:parvulin-like peptidyl-prolyl isomerase